MKSRLKYMLYLIPLIVFSCNQQAGDSKTQKESKGLGAGPQGDKKDSLAGQTHLPDSLLCVYDSYLKAPETSSLAKAIYLKKHWDLENDTLALALIDSLSAKNRDSRPFYFKVVTLSYAKADGYFAEALGYGGKRYVDSNTVEFLSRFDNHYCFSSRDLETWANILMLYFGIGADYKPDKQGMIKYTHQLESKCKNCSTTQLQTLSRLSELLKVKWEALLKKPAQDAG
jgi:hypothetical protein